MTDKQLMKQCLIEANEIVCEVDEYLEKKLEEAYDEADGKVVEVAYETRGVLQNQIGEIAGRLFDAARSRERKRGMAFGEFILNEKKQNALLGELIDMVKWLNTNGKYSPEAEGQFCKLANGIIEALEEIVGVRGGKEDE